jgi:hypothetical protein
MAEKSVTIEPAITPEHAEPVYILLPHPEAHTVSNAETIIPEEPTAAEETLDDMIQQAVAGLRGELKAELQQELQIERGGELNVKG